MASEPVHTKDAILGGALYLLQPVPFPTDGGTIELFGEGRQRRDLNYIDDVVDALLAVGANEEANGKIFNLGHHEVVSLAEVAKEAIRFTGCGNAVGVPFPLERQLIDIGNCYSSYRKIEHTLGWQPRVNLMEGLERTIEFYRQNREHYWSANEDTVSPAHTLLRRVK